MNQKLKHLKMWANDLPEIRENDEVDIVVNIAPQMTIRGKISEFITAPESVEIRVDYNANAKLLDLTPKTFGERLKLLRQDRGLSQAVVASRTGIAASALSAYETNLRQPSLKALAKITRTLGGSTDWLLGLSANE